jgi:hypothetical protein
MRPETFKGPELTRTVSPSTHPRLASGDATDFLLASALSVFHQQALRPPGGEDAQCVQPISATQSNCVYPHLVRSRLAHATFAAGTPHRVLGSVRLIGGLDVSRHPHDRFGGSKLFLQHSLRLELLGLTTNFFWSHERGRFLPTVLIRSSL